MSGHSVRVDRLAIETPRAPARGGTQLGAALQTALTGALARTDLAGVQPHSLEALRIDLPHGAGAADVARAVADTVARATQGRQR
jgi:hypothetical protein